MFFEPHYSMKKSTICFSKFVSLYDWLFVTIFFPFPGKIFIDSSKVHWSLEKWKWPRPYSSLSGDYKRCCSRMGPICSDAQNLPYFRSPGRTASRFEASSSGTFYLLHFVFFQIKQYSVFSWQPVAPLQTLLTFCFWVPKRARWSQNLVLGKTF
jgi:hypothetical protein